MLLSIENIENKHENQSLNEIVNEAFQKLEIVANTGHEEAIYFLGTKFLVCLFF